MNSSEGENIMFLSSTILEGPVEVRMHVINDTVVTGTLRDILARICGLAVSAG